MAQEVTLATAIGSYRYCLCGNFRRIRRLASLPVERQRHDNGHCARACRRRHALRGFERRRRCENAKTGQVIWSHTYTNPSEPQALIKAQSNAASEIATAIGQPYGVVTSDLRRSIPSVSSMQSYVCVLRAYAFRRNFCKTFDEVGRLAMEIAFEATLSASPLRFGATSRSANVDFSSSSSLLALADRLSVEAAQPSAQELPDAASA